MPIADEVDGTQHIAVQSGWASTRSASRTHWRRGKVPGLENNVPQGGVVWVSAVKK